MLTCLINHFLQSMKCLNQRGQVSKRPASNKIERVAVAPWQTQSASRALEMQGRLCG